MVEFKDKHAMIGRVKPKSSVSLPIIPKQKSRIIVIDLKEDHITVDTSAVRKKAKISKQNAINLAKWILAHYEG